MVKRILSILIIYAGAVSLLHAQGSATEGKEFYVNFTQNYTYSSTNSAATIQIRYVVSDTCYITTQYGDGTYLDNNVQYLPGTYTKNVDKSKAYTDFSSTVITNDKFLKITSTKNIGVYAINMASATTDATTVLPIGSLGNHYTVIANDVTGVYYTNLSIIAPIAGTTITIKDPTGTPIVSNVSVPVGVVYIYPFNSVGDLTGYTVESNVNVCVFVAVGCGNPHPGGGCDFNWEQLWPTNTAGRNYLVWSLSQFNSQNPQATDYIKVIALDNNTTITQNVGGTISTILLNKLQVNAFNTPSAISNNPYANNASSIIKLSSDKPFLVGHILGHAPCIKQISPIEQRVTKAVITPFIPKGTSVITTHKLHILIPASSESNMYVKEVRNGVETEDTLTFYTNTTDTNYKIAYKDYAQYDSVLVYLSNSAGFVAYMAGYGQAESYIITAGAGALDLSAYFTFEGIHYQTIDNTLICRQNTYTLKSFGITDPNLTVLWKRDGVVVGMGQTYIETYPMQSGVMYHFEMVAMDIYGTFLRTWSCMVYVTPRPNIANKTATICSGSAFSVTLSPNDTTGINPTYAWTVSTPNANIIGATDQTTTQLSTGQTLINTSNTAQSVVYTVTPTAGTCVGAPFTVTVTVNPKAGITAKTATICSGSAFLITPTNGIDGDTIPSGTTYTWTVPNNSLGATNQYSPQTSISQILTNAGNTAQNVTYTVIATSGTCTSTFTITVTVYPFPILNTDITGPHTVCVGNTIQLSNATAGGAWTVNNSNAAIADPIINPEPVTGIAVGNAYITYTLFYGQCESKKTFLLKIIPATTPNVKIGFEK